MHIIESTGDVFRLLEERLQGLEASVNVEAVRGICNTWHSAEAAAAGCAGTGCHLCAAAGRWSATAVQAEVSRQTEELAGSVLAALSLRAPAAWAAPPAIHHRCSRSTRCRAWAWPCTAVAVGPGWLHTARWSTTHGCC